MNLHSEFLRLCDEVAAQADVLHTENSTDKGITSYSLYYRVCRIDLVYSRRWETLAPPSVLYARIYLNKNNPMFLHLPELIAYLHIADYRACYFPCIESTERMSVCFDALMNILRDYIPIAEQLGWKGEDRPILEWSACGGFFGLDKENSEQQVEDKDKLEEDEDEIHWDTASILRGFTEATMVARHTNLDAYEAFLNGDREKAIKLFEKMKKSDLSLYEIGLLNFLKSEDSCGFVAIPPQCHSAPEYKKFEKGDIADVKGIALLFACFSAILCGALAVTNAILSRGAIYFSGVWWWFGFVLAGLPTIFFYCGFRRELRRKLGGNNAFSSIEKNSIRMRNFVWLICGASVLGCLWFCIAVPKMSARYYETYAICYMGNDKAERFEYKDVTDIFHIRARYNDFDGRVERDSYVLLLKDGRYYDMDCDFDVQEQLRIIQQVFPNYTICELDSDRDLPKGK